jgi:hypothetical protein
MGIEPVNGGVKALGSKRIQFDFEFEFEFEGVRYRPTLIRIP